MKRLILILMLLAGPAFAVQPHEMLADPVLEARAQELDKQLRCVKCQSEALASSNAEWAADARVLLRELLVDGYSDQDVIDFFVVRYGEYVLMKPQTGGANAILWWAGPGMLVLALLIGGLYLRRRSAPEVAAPAVDGLTEDEKARLADLMKD